MQLPRSISKLIDAFEKLPGLGPKSAGRLTFYLLHVPQLQLDEFADATKNLKLNTVLCSLCFNIAEADPCPVCTDPTREKSVILVVEQPLDVLAIEKTGRYKGLYHVLHGAISPLNNIGPDELYINQLIERVSLRSRGSSDQTISEIILAMYPNMEGEATAMYLRQQCNNATMQQCKITRLGQGLPTGGDLEYADETTLQKSLEGRREY